MKIRALIWDNLNPHQSITRCGPLRRHTNSHDAIKDLEKLKQHAHGIMEEHIYSNGYGDPGKKYFDMRKYEVDSIFGPDQINGDF